MTEAAVDSSPQELAKKFSSEDRLFDAYRELQKVKEEDLTEEEKETIKIAESCQKFADLIKGEVDPTWTSLGESKKNYRYQNMHYKLDTQPVRVDMTIESPVETSLVIPLIATLNEVDLYSSWLPNWNKPKFRVTRSETLKKTGKLSQVFTTRTETPQNTVEFYVNATVLDDSETSKEFVVNLDALKPGEADGLCPDPVEGVNRILLSGGMMFRKCPDDVAARAKELRKKNKNAKDEDIVMVSLSIVYSNPTKFLKPNFIMRQVGLFILKTVIGAMWSKLLGVAEEIRDGKRPEFDKLMEERKETYDWVKKCADNIV